MIYEVKMYSATCDNCGKAWEDTDTGYVALNCHQGMRDNLMDSEWYVTEDDKCYCSDCAELDDDDNLVIDKTRTKGQDETTLYHSQR